MSPLFRRTRRAHDETAADAAATAEAQTIADVPGEAKGTAPVPAAELDALVGEAPASRRRGRLRRRLRHLRRVREVLLRDLGGLMFEVHRSGAAGSASGVVDSKLARLEQVQAEIRSLEAELDDRRPMVVREAGIGGACPECGEIFGSEARYCWACGAQVAAGRGAEPMLAPYVAAPQLTAPAPGGRPWTPAEPPEAETVETPPAQPEASEWIPRAPEGRDR